MTTIPDELVAAVADMARAASSVQRELVRWPQECAAAVETYRPAVRSVAVPHHDETVGERLRDQARQHLYLAVAAFAEARLADLHDSPHPMTVRGVHVDRLDSGERHRIAAIRIPCPSCGAPAGRPCVIRTPPTEEAA